MGAVIELRAVAGSALAAMADPDRWLREAGRRMVAAVAAEPGAR